MQVKILKYKNIYRIQAYDSILCGSFYIGFIDFMLKGKGLLECTNLFSPNDYKTEDKIKYFQWLKRWKNCIVLFVASLENLKNVKSHTS